MQGKLMLVVGLAIGYVVGTRRGRQGYEQLKQQAGDLWRNPKVQETVADAQEVMKSKVPLIGEPISNAIDKAKSNSSSSDLTSPDEGSPARV